MFNLRSTGNRQNASPPLEPLCLWVRGPAGTGMRDDGNFGAFVSMTIDLRRQDRSYGVGR